MYGHSEHMDILSTNEAKAQLLNLVAQVNQDHRPREISSHQSNAVLLSKENWESIQETLYLQSIQSIPGLVQSIKSAEQEDDWVSEDEFLEQLNGMDSLGVIDELDSEVL